MVFSYLAVFALLLQPPQVVEQACPPSIDRKIVLRYRSPRELDPLIGPIYYPSRERLVWPSYGMPPRPGDSYGDGASRPRVMGPMRGAGVDHIVAMEDGSLLVQGDQADIDELVALVHVLDFPIPSIECRLEVVRGKQKLLTTTAAGKAGTVVKATNALTGPAAVAARVEVTFKILPLGVGRYEIESQGKVSVPLAKRGMRLEKTFQGTREFTPGQTLTLDRVEIGGETIRLILTLNRIVPPPGGG